MDDLLKKFDVLSTPMLKWTMRESLKIKEQSGHSYLGQEHMLLSMIESEGIVREIFQKLNIDREQIERIISEIRG